MRHKVDLSLVLIGVALAKSERARVVAIADDVDGNAGDALRAIRDNDCAVFTQWLRNAGVTLEKGKDAIQSIVDTVSNDGKVRKARHVAAKVEMVATQSDIDVLRDVLRDALAELGE